MRAGSRCGLSLLAVVAAILALPMAAAGEHPNRGRGLDPEASYQQVGVLDSVNLFNGTPVIRIPIGPTYPVAGSLNYSLALYYSGNVWDQEWRQDGQNLYSQALPNRRSNAGLGWLLSLGRMILPSDPTNHTGAYWLYESPDGSEHVLYPTLHNGEAMISGVFYSRNGTYLRFKSTPMTLEFPDGKIHTFNAQGQITQISDRFGNYLNITYPNSVTWQLTDQHGRSHFVYFVNQQYDTWSQRIAFQVVLTAFNGTTATYGLGYNYPTVSRYCDTDPQTSNAITSMPLLSSISLPDGSSYSIPVGDYDKGDGVSCSNSSGQLRGITLPTLGRIEWDYTTWVYPSIAGTCDDFFARSNGISKRRLRRADGVADGEWTYTPALDSPDGCANPNARELKVTVNDPLTHKQEHFFSVSLIDTGAWKKGEYGMPFTHHVADGTGTRFLSSRTYSGPSTLLRRGFSRWEYEAPWETTPTFSLYDGNRRLVSGRTVFEDDGAKYADLDLSYFDGLGHYRQSATNGNFDSGNVRTIFANFNPSNGIYPGTFVMVPSTSPWVLETFAHRDEIEASVTARTEFCFNSTTGALDRVRTLKTGTTRGASDLLAVYTVDSAGQVTQERYFGGDTPPSISTSGSCSFGLPADDYRIDHTYQYGVRKTSEYRDAAGIPLSFKSLDVDVDLNTGLVRASRDTSGIQTDFEYDSLGRLRFSKPAAGHDGWTETAYTRATSPASLARTNVYRRANGVASGASLAQNEIRYDSFGRVSEDRVLMPNGSWSGRVTTYNGREWTNTVSEQGSPSSVTQYLSYDPFGRPGIVRPPDGSAHDVTFSYLGDRQKSRTEKIATTQHFDGSIIENPATTTERYDRQGRLWQVVQPVGPLTATHGYDVGGRLKTVNLTAGSTTQNRVFTYDNRGFLNSEQHPEKGSTSGNGTVLYSGYDARGHATRKVDGPNDLTFTYDRAERVTQVSETGGAQRTLKTFTYGTSSAFGVWNNGKRTIAERFNYTSLPSASTVKVQDVYYYAQRQGRVSYKAVQATVNGTPRESFAQSFSFNDLGQVNSLVYPDCTHSPCTSQAADPETIGFTYTNGFLTSIPYRLTSITYHPNALASQITHGNNVLETHGYDPNGITRARSFVAQYLSNPRWSSGNYQYDGAGNVKKIGNSVYLYDLAGRLTSGKVYADPFGGGSPSLQTYSYDPFGNIQTIGGDVGRATPTSSLTNRLTGAVAYDTAGNLTSWNGNGYTYDQFSLMSRMLAGSENWYYFYTADDERIWTHKATGAIRSEWSLRGLDNKTLTVHTEAGGYWFLTRQFVYRDGSLAAAKTGGQWRAMHLDHLGTPRAITDFSGSNTAYHAYYAFGEEVTGFAQDDETMKFTGHERDLASTAGSGDDLDYMHARHFSPLTARFLGTDLVAGDASSPQSWNRYSYVLGSPVSLVDPSGMVEEGPGAGGTCTGVGGSLRCTGYGGVIGPDPRIPGALWFIYFDRLRRGRGLNDVNDNPNGGPGDRDGEGGGIRERLLVRRPPPFLTDCRDSFAERWWNNVVETNRAIPGLTIPTGSGLLTGGVVAREFGLVTFRQWVFSGFRGLVIGGAQHGALSTGVTAIAAVPLINSVLGGLAFEGGIAVGSAVNVALIQPCAPATTP